MRTCPTAGIRPIMITGDHPLTARYIAAELGISPRWQGASPGSSWPTCRRRNWTRWSPDHSVFARVSPEHKLRIVQALQRTGQIAAMTGDGVNDAPALKKADIGVAMGITGTDVSKEAADMVLTDDNFATIVAAVEEGRMIYDNIRKFIKYTLTSNAGEIWVMLLAPFLGMPLPLLPLQILWINLVTDGLPGLALGRGEGRAEHHAPPALPAEREHLRAWDGQGYPLGRVVDGLVVPGGWVLSTGAQDNPAWQTMIFTTLTLSEMGYVMAIRSVRDSLFRIGLFSNRALLGAVLLTTCLAAGRRLRPLHAEPVRDRSAAAGRSAGVFRGQRGPVLRRGSSEVDLAPPAGLAAGRRL